MKWINAKEDIEDIKENIINMLQEAIDSIYEAVESLESAKSEMKDLPYDYDITGNMDAYVLSYLTEGTDSIVDRIEGYIEDTEELENEDEDEDKKEK